MENSRPVKINKEIFERSLKPLVTLIFIKLSKCDRFFNKIMININGEEFENSLEKILKIYSSKLYGGTDSIDLSYKYQGLQYLKNDDKYEYILEMKFLFDEESYHIKISSGSVRNILKPYTEFLSSEEIETLSDGLLKDLMSDLEKTVKTK